MSAHDDKVRAKLLDLARRLAVQTREGRIDWEPYGREHWYSHKTQSGSVSVTQDRFQGDRRYLHVLNQFGVIVAALEEPLELTTPEDATVRRALTELYAAIESNSQHFLDGLLAEIG
jgi:hypothetical protein